MFLLQARFPAIAGHLVSASILSATLACLVTAAVAGTVYTGGSVLFGR